MPDYDLITIGAGGAGSEVSYYAHSKGWKVAMIERDRIGGLCLNYGCDPTKSMLESARVAQLARRAPEFGLVIPEVRVDMPAVVATKDEILVQMAGGPGAVERVRALGIDYYEGPGRFVEPLAVEVNGQVLRGREIVIATGTHASVPPIEGLADAGYITNVEAVSLKEVPARVAVIGAGPIGLEFAQMLRRLGSQVTLLEAAPRIALTEEPEISDFLASRLRMEGIDVIEAASVLSVQRTPTGKRLTLNPPGVHPRSMIDMPLFDRERLMIAEGVAAGAKREIEVDEILVATGRTPNIEGLGLEIPGVRTHKRGVIVDDQMRTSAPHVWACGDITGQYQFTHMSDYQAQVLRANMIDGIETWAEYRAIPWCIFTDPEVAHVGLTEDQARADRSDVQTFLYEGNELPRALTMREDAVLIKLVTNSAGSILGANIVAPEAGSMLGILALAMRHGLTVHDVAATILPYPTMGEAVRWACKSMSEQLRSGSNPPLP